MIKKIDEKKIEEAARNYAFDKYDSTDDEVEDTYTEELQMSFEAGINWFLDNLWHDASEEPKYYRPLLYEHRSGRYFVFANQMSYCSWRDRREIHGITRWLYIDDLLKGGNND